MERSRARISSWQAWLPVSISLLGSIFGSFIALPLTAQTIIPEVEGTGTKIIVENGQYNIYNGSFSGDGRNLFHSFERFGLNAGEIVNFISAPNIENIFSRVMGGDPSMINGTIQVLQGHSHLFLMNPAGIVFGTNASLNVPGDFTATTATRIGLGENWFNGFGSNDYYNLIGVPNRLAFDLEQPGAIINTGTLRISQGNLTLLGGSILNTGTLDAPIGTINIAAVPGERWVKISHPEMLLSLEVPAEAVETGFSALDLPRLLTASNVQSATQIITNEEQNIIALGREIIWESGDVSLLGNLRAERINLAALNQVRVDRSEITQIDTGDGIYSTPTVTKFARSLQDPRAYIFVDATIENYRDFLYGGKAGTTTVVITPEERGISAIGDRLSARAQAETKVEEVHIVTEGNVGNFWLGQDFISANNIDEYREELRTWSASLSANADILLYSCLTALGEAGNTLIAAIATETGADVAASTNLTGNAALGGDWILEKNTGNIEASLGFTSETLQRFQDTLAVITVDSNLDIDALDGAVTLREAIAATNTNSNYNDAIATGFGNDEIRFPHP